MPLSPRLLRPRASATSTGFDPRSLGSMHLWLSAAVNGNAGTTWADLSGNGRNATKVNSPTYDTANGGAVQFDGVDDHITVASVTDSLVSSTSAYTIGLWVRPTGNQNARGIFAIQNAVSSTAPFVLLQRNAGPLTTRWLVNNAYPSSFVYSVPDNAYSLLLISYNGNSSYTAYLNGGNQQTYSGGVFGSVPASLFLAQGFNGYFGGRIAEFYMWSSVLSASAVSSLYSSTAGRFA